MDFIISNNVFKIKEVMEFLMTLSILRVVKEYLVMAKFKTITSGPERQFLIAFKKHQFPNKNDYSKNVY